MGLDMCMGYVNLDIHPTSYYMVLKLLSNPARNAVRKKIHSMFVISQDNFTVPCICMFATCGIVVYFFFLQ